MAQSAEQFIRDQLSAGGMNLSSWYTRDDPVVQHGPWYGRTYESLTEAEKLQILNSRHSNLEGSGTNPLAIAELKSDSLTDLHRPENEFGDFMEGLAPILAFAGPAFMGGAFSGLAGEAAGGAFDMGVGGVGEAMGMGSGYTSPSVGGSSLMDMINSTKGDTPYLRTGDIANASELFNLNDIIENTGNVTGGVSADTATTASSVADEFGNFDIGSGTTGTDPSTGGDTTATAATTGGTTAGGTSAVTDTVKTAATYKSLWDKFLESGDPSDLMKIIGAAAPGLFSEYFNNERSDNLSKSLTEIANTARADRAPFLNYATSSLAGGPGAYATTGPGGESLRAVLNKLSVQGNPIGNPVLLGIATDSANRTWQDDWRQAANLGLGGNYSQLATNAATAGAGTTGAGYGDAVASVFGEKNTLEQLLAKYKGFGDIFTVKP